jgi:hypothetical protein
VLYQCLTQRRPKPDGNDPSIQLLPPPFIQIVRRALSGLATVAEITAMLRPAAAAVAPAKAPEKEAKATPEKVAPKPVVVEKEAPIVEDEPVARGSSPQRMLWIVGAVVALLLLVGLAVRGLKHSSMQAPASTTSSAENDPPPEPSSKPAAALPKAAPAPVPAPAATPAGDWRVVAFTYNHQDQAEHKAQTIGAKHPELQAGVFSPKSGRAPYLVTLGGPMDRDAAFQLRNKAIRAGLPHDTYAQNYSH